MILYPAIDLKDGQCVRLLRGDMGRATVFSATPGEQARIWQDAGFGWVHVVDLNGAFAGKPVNESAVRDILAAVDIPVQIGGGIRDLDTIERWLAEGIARVILGTAAVKNPTLVREACRAFPGKVAVGIDARGGIAAVEGWAEQSDVSALELARRFEDDGVAAIVYTDIEQDGAMQGPNIAETARLARGIRIPVIASGGVSRVEDIRALKQYEADGIAGAIVGRALYDGALIPAEALSAAL